MKKLPMNKLLVGLGVFGFLVVAFAFGFYQVKVGMSLFATSAEWGQLGDFIGGITSPLLSLLAFLGVLYTIHQNNVDRHERIQTQKMDETYKVIETIFSRIEFSLENFEFTAMDMGFVKPVTVARFLSVGDPPKEYLNHPNLDNDNVCQRLSTLVCSIKTYCELYVKYGGSEDTTRFFKTHYWDLAFFLICTKHLDKETFDYFEAVSSKA